MIIDNCLLDKVTAEAKASPRLRMNYNLHDSLDAKAQRLLNAMEPGTVMPIHRHQHTAESYFLIRGRVTVLFCNENKVVTERFDLNPLEGNYAVQVPAGQWHTVKGHESGTVIFGVKDGPYIPSAPEDMMG